jgi:hypothetical protein
VLTFGFVVRLLRAVINHRHRMAQMCGRASSELYTLLFFRGKRVEEDALVISVRSNGIRVLIPRYGIEGAIRLVSAEEEEALQNMAQPDLSKTYVYNEEVRFVLGLYPARSLLQVSVCLCLRHRTCRCLVRWVRSQSSKSCGLSFRSPNPKCDGLSLSLSLFFVCHSILTLPFGR